MIPMMVEILGEQETGETEVGLRAVVAEFVDRLTGQQTIYQMILVCEPETQDEKTKRKKGRHTKTKFRKEKRKNSKQQKGKTWHTGTLYSKGRDDSIPW